MNIYVVPEVDLRRFTETGVVIVQPLNGEYMIHD